jgi:hypothetical protein
LATGGQRQLHVWEHGGGDGWVWEGCGALLWWIGGREQRQWCLLYRGDRRAWWRRAMLIISENTLMPVAWGTAGAIEINK